jgi:hypothetical protein
MYKRNGFQVPMPLCAIYSILCVTWCQLGIIDIFDCVPLARLCVLGKGSGNLKMI